MISSDQEQLAVRMDFVPPPIWTAHDENYMLLNFPFLSADCLCAVFEFELQSICALVENQIDMKEITAEITQALNLHATEQMALLCDAACADEGEELALKRRLLWLTVLYPEKLPPDLRQEFTDLAAESLAKVKLWNCMCDHSLSAAVACLTRRLGSSERVRHATLSIFMKLATREFNRLSDAKIGGVLTEALLLELSRPDTLQSQTFTASLLSLMQMYKYPAALEVLQVMSESHWSAEIRRQASDIIPILNETMEDLWSRSQMTGKELSINEWKELLLLDIFSHKHCHRLFTLVKGLDFASIPSDIADVLYRLLKSSDERTKLAICFAMLRGNIDFHSPIGQRCISDLANLVVSAQSKFVMDESLQLLSWLKLNKPSSVRILDEKCAEASSYYVEKFFAVQMLSRGKY